jgi:hypothetical protein
VFIQIIQGRCTRQDEMRELADRWRTEVDNGETGFLGGTYGFTDDDQFVGVVRFASREHAMANSARPEQNAWAEKLMELVDGPLTFHDCDDVTLAMDAFSDRAGFVQVIQGTVDDPAAMKSMMADTETLHRERPDILGGCLAIDENGSFTETIFFTSEAEARAGEKKAMPEDVQRTMDSAMHDVSYLDLRHPWFESA